VIRTGLADPAVAAATMRTHPTSLPQFSVHSYQIAQGDDRGRRADRAESYRLISGHSPCRAVADEVGGIPGRKAFAPFVHVGTLPALNFSIKADSIGPLAGYKAAMSWPGAPAKSRR
jgi:hypothetical protein